MKRLIALIFALACTCSAQNTTNYARMLSGVNYQTGTTYLFQAVDSTRVTSFSNASPIAAQLPPPTTANFGAGTEFTFTNAGAGQLTVTCSGCTINGVSSISLLQNQGADIFSDGTNYAAQLYAVTSVGGNVAAAQQGAMTWYPQIGSQPNVAGDPNTSLDGNGNAGVKTLTVNGTGTGRIDFGVGTTPLTPPSGKVRVYASSNQLNCINSSGVDCFFHNVVYADLMTGATADAKITAAANSCTTTGCYIDACGLNGAQSFLADPLPNGHQYSLHLCNATYSYDPVSMAFTLPSNTRLILDNATITSTRTDGSGNSTPNIIVGLVSSRAYQVTGSITTGTNTLTVSSATNATVGAVVGIVGAFGGMNGTHGWGTQSTTINQGGGMGAGDSGVVATNTAGFNAGSDIYGPFLLIDNEIIGYTASTGTTFTGFTRGKFGTTAATHANGATIYQLGSMVSQITGISGNVLTLQDNATFTVANANVVIGSTHVSIEGSGTIDGNYTNRAIAQSSPVYAIALPFASLSYVGPNIVMQNFAVHTLFSFQGWRNEIHGVFRFGGRPAAGIGADVLLGGSRYNKVITNSHENGNFILLTDDRSTNSGIFDGPSSNNVIDIGSQVGTAQYTQAIGIEGGNNNSVRSGAVSCNTAVTLGCVYITSSGQWTVDPPISGNVINVGAVNATGGGDSLTISPLATAVGNVITSGKITGGGLIQCVTPNQCTYLDINNVLNFSDPVNSFNFKRSGGNAGFADLNGDGTHQLVVGDLNGISLTTNANLRIPGGMIVGNADATGAKAFSLNFQRSAGASSAPDISGDGTHELVVGGKGDGTGGVALGVSSTLRLGTLTVSTLPAAASSTGIIVHVNDSTAIGTQGQACVGGSVTHAIAFSDGGVWHCFASSSASWFQLGGASGIVAGVGSALNATRVWAYQMPVSVAGSTKFSYHVQTADNSADTYDMGIYDSGGTLVCHTGSTPGTTLFPSTGVKIGTWTAPCNVPAGQIYFAITAGTAGTAVPGGLANSPSVSCGVATATNNTTSGGTLNSSVTFTANALVNCTLPNIAVSTL